MTIREGESVLELKCQSDGSGDYLASIEVRVDGFAGHADGHIVGGEWTAFADALRTLEATRNGEARLASAMPGEFELRIHAINSRGHMGVSGLLHYRRVGADEWPDQQLRFAFEFDQAMLPAFARAVALVR